MGVNIAFRYRKVSIDINLCSNWKEVIGLLGSGRYSAVCFVNPNFLNSSHLKTISELNNILFLIDGAGMRLWVRMVFGYQIVLNTNGTDMFTGAWGSQIVKSKKILCIGGRVGSESVIQKYFLDIGSEDVSVVNGFRFDDEEFVSIIKRSQRNVDIILVGMGGGRQEKLLCDVFMSQDGFLDKSAISRALLINVGGLFDFIDGTYSRAPQIVRRMQLEWVWRWLQAPSKRMVKMKEILFFLIELFRELFKLKKSVSN